MHSGLWTNLRKDLNALRRGKPGSRFQDFRERRRKRRGGAWSRERIGMLALGMILVIAGLAIGWLPGPGGFLSIIGVAVLAQEIPQVAKALDWVEVRIRGLFHSGARVTR